MMSSSCRVVSSVTTGAEKKGHNFLAFLTKTFSHFNSNHQITDIYHQSHLPILDVWSNSTSSSSMLFSGRACAVTSPDNCQGFSARATFSSSMIFCDICKFMQWNTMITFKSPQSDNECTAKKDSQLFLTIFSLFQICTFPALQKIYSLECLQQKTA